MSCNHCSNCVHRGRCGSPNCTPVELEYDASDAFDAYYAGMNWAAGFPAFEPLFETPRPITSFYWKYFWEGAQNYPLS